MAIKNVEKLMTEGIDDFMSTVVNDRSDKESIRIGLIIGAYMVLETSRAIAESCANPDRAVYLMHALVRDVNDLMATLTKQYPMSDQQLQGRKLH